MAVSYERGTPVVPKNNSKWRAPTHDIEGGRAVALAALLILSVSYQLTYVIYQLIYVRYQLIYVRNQLIYVRSLLIY